MDELNVKETSQNAIVFCRVDGCGRDLTSSSRYSIRQRICEEHLQALQVTFQGQICRFCQQCACLQPLEEFDDLKRSCRAALKLRLEQRKRRRMGGLLGFESSKSRSASSRAAASTSHSTGPCWAGSRNTTRGSMAHSDPRYGVSSRIKEEEEGRATQPRHGAVPDNGRTGVASVNTPYLGIHGTVPIQNHEFHPYHYQDAELRHEDEALAWGKRQKLAKDLLSTSQDPVGRFLLPEDCDMSHLTPVLGDPFVYGPLASENLAPDMNLYQGVADAVNIQLKKGSSLPDVLVEWLPSTTSSAATCMINGDVDFSWDQELGLAGEHGPSGRWPSWLLDEHLLKESDMGIMGTRDLLEDCIGSATPSPAEAAVSSGAMGLPCPSRSCSPQEGALPHCTLEGEHDWKPDAHAVITIRPAKLLQDQGQASCWNSNTALDDASSLTFLTPEMPLIKGTLLSMSPPAVKPTQVAASLSALNVPLTEAQSLAMCAEIVATEQQPVPLGRSLTTHQRFHDPEIEGSTPKANGEGDAPVLKPPSKQAKDLEGHVRLWQEDEYTGPHLYSPRPVRDECHHWSKVVIPLGDDLPVAWRLPSNSQCAEASHGLGRGPRGQPARVLGSGPPSTVYSGDCYHEGGPCWVERLMYPDVSGYASRGHWGAMRHAEEYGDHLHYRSGYDPLLPEGSGGYPHHLRREHPIRGMHSQRVGMHPSDAVLFPPRQHLLSHLESQMRVISPPIDPDMMVPTWTLADTSHGAHPGGRSPSGACHRPTGRHYARGLPHGSPLPRDPFGQCR